MKEEFVPFELAKKLQEKGYDWQTFDWYDSLGNFNKGMMPRTLQGCPIHREYYAPTIGLALKWLREEKKIHILTATYHHNIPLSIHDWGYEVVDLQTYTSEYDDYGYDSYEEATLVGVKFVLDNLI